MEAAITQSELESEAIYIMREVFAQFENPALLFSGGKDSIVLVHLARKAFYPMAVPFPLLHIDTGHNFPETIAFRDELVSRGDLRLIVKFVQESIDSGKAREEHGKYASRNALQSITLLDAIRDEKFDACIGGARRDEEKARAKERVFSVRDSFGAWNEINQRPEVFDSYNGSIRMGQHVRVFPLSNWTERTVWEYIRRENIAVPSLYFAHARRVFVREGFLWSESEHVWQDDAETASEKTVRFRTVGDITCTAALESEARTVDDILREMRESGISERAARLDDRRSESAMEKRKKEGYF